ncbi:MAG: NAD(P)H-dependent oxidoreductase [Thermoleophilaceae bacterium]|nr:NAD(P)H-dependent oxidoreductase [Thermoleophilaceae bacterium]
MRILGISGSFRRDSHNTRLLRAAALTLPPGAELELFDGLGALPLYCEDGDTHPVPETVERLRGQIAAADALLIATPEYNASIPGVLKNAIDWASRPFPDNALRGKPVAVIGASTGLFGAVWAQSELRKVLNHTGADVLEAELPVGLASQAFTPTGELADPELQRRLVELTGALAREAAGNVTRTDDRVEPRDRTPALRAV